MIELARAVRDSIVDGPGVRVTLFAQGCPHRCPGCHNPQTWEFGCGAKLDEETLIQFAVCNPLCKGVTFSGGEPFAQAAGFASLARKLRGMGYEVASYTGYTFEELLNGTKEQRELLENIDVLIDGPFIQELRSMELSFRGSTNQRILNVPASLAAGEAVPEKSKRWQGKY